MANYYRTGRGNWTPPKAKIGGRTTGEKLAKKAEYMYFAALQWSERAECASIQQNKNKQKPKLTKGKLANIVKSHLVPCNASPIHPSVQPLPPPTWPADRTACLPAASPAPTPAPLSVSCGGSSPPAGRHSAAPAVGVTCEAFRGR